MKHKISAYLCVVFLCALCGTNVFSQTNKGISVIEETPKPVEGKTYALIIGISKYTNFPSLEFADRDAIAFYNYLRSASGGNVDSMNIRLLLNENAKAGDIWLKGVSWLMRRTLNKGDRVYIYFSGHGDAANEQEAYLLANDAPNEGDPNLYNAGGTIQVFNLKSKVRQLTAQGVETILITDACRSNELPGKSDGARWTFARIMESQSGELQMASCSANEQAQEAKIWGGGRGVFSYYLINGLQGLADTDPADGEVSFYELQQYVKTNVRKATIETRSSKPAQNPVFCCGDKDNEILCKVDAKTLAELKNTIRQSIEQPLEANARDIKSEESKTQNYYNLFREAEDKGNLLKPDSSSAYYYYQKLQSRIPDEGVRADLRDWFSAALINQTQRVINDYMGKAAQRARATKEFPAVNDYIRVINEMNPGQKELTPDLEVTSLFAKAVLLRKSLLYNDLVKANALLDRAIALAPTAAYLYERKGFNYIDQSHADSALIMLRKAHELAPRWHIPIVEMAYPFQDPSFGSPDSVIYYAQLGLQFDSLDPDNDYLLGIAYFQKQNAAASLRHFYKYLKVHPHSRVYTNMAQAYQLNNQIDSAIWACRTALSMDSNFFQAYYYLGYLYADKKEYANSFKSLNRCLQIDSSYWYAYFSLFTTYMGTKDYAHAIQSLDLYWQHMIHDRGTSLLTLQAEFAVEQYALYRKRADVKQLMRKYFPAPYKQ